MIVSPPRLVGTATVAEIFGVKPRWMRHKLAAGQASAGYLGKIGGRHTWNLHELVASLFTSDAAIEMVVDRLTDRTPADPLDTMLCAIPDCDRLDAMIGLCTIHLRHLVTSWRHAGRSQLVTVQLVAMCRWVVERNAHIVLPTGFDPWAPVCMNPGCDNATNVHGPNGWHGPLCPSCTAAFWGNSVLRPRPSHWKGAA